MENQSANIDTSATSEPTYSFAIAHEGIEATESENYATKNMLPNSAADVNSSCPVFSAAVPTGVLGAIPEGAVFQIMSDAAILRLAAGTKVLSKEPQFTSDLASPDVTLASDLKNGCLQLDQNSIVCLPALAVGMPQQIAVHTAENCSSTEGNISDIDLSFLNEPEVISTDSKLRSATHVEFNEPLQQVLPEQLALEVQNNRSLTANSKTVLRKETEHQNIDIAEPEKDPDSGVVVVDVSKPIQLTQNCLIVVDGQKCILQHDPQSGQIVAYPIKEPEKPKRKRGRPRKPLTSEESANSANASAAGDGNETEYCSEEDQIAAEKGLLEVVTDDGAVVRRSSRKRKMAKLLKDYEVGSLQQELGSDADDKDLGKDETKISIKRRGKRPGRPRKDVNELQHSYLKSKLQKGRPKKIIEQKEPTQAFLIQTADGQNLMMQVPLSSIPPGMSLQDVAQDIANKLNLSFSQEQASISQSTSETTLNSEAHQEHNESLSVQSPTSDLSLPVNYKSETVNRSLPSTMTENIDPTHSTDQNQNLTESNNSLLNFSDFSHLTEKTSCEEPVCTSKEILSQMQPLFEETSSSDLDNLNSARDTDTANISAKSSVTEMQELKDCPSEQENLLNFNSDQSAGCIATKTGDMESDIDSFFTSKIQNVDSVVSSSAETVVTSSDPLNSCSTMQTENQENTKTLCETDCLSSCSSSNLCVTLSETVNTTASSLISTFSTMSSDSTKTDINIGELNTTFVKQLSVSTLQANSSESSQMVNIVRRKRGRPSKNSKLLQSDDDHEKVLPENVEVNVTSLSNVGTLFTVNTAQSSNNGSMSSATGPSATVIPLSEKALPLLLPKPKESDISPPYDVTVFKCARCEYQAIYKNEYQQHLLIHPDDTKKCKCCPFLCFTDEELYSHYHETHPRCICTVCNYAAEQPYIVKRHMYRHAQSVCSCDICGKTYKDHYILKMHIKMVHLPADVLFKCHLCDKEFNRKAHLKRHLRTHDPEKPFKCFHCDYRGCEKSDVTKHMLIHEEPKHHCEVCGKSFRHIKNKDLHVKRHKGQRDYKCGICDFYGYTFTDIRKHIQRRHKDPGICVCEKCGQAFKSQELLQEHQSSNHCEALALEQALYNTEQTLLDVSNEEDSSHLEDAEVENIVFDSGSDKEHNSPHGESLEEGNLVVQNNCKIVYKIEDLISNKNSYTNINESDKKESPFSSDLLTSSCSIQDKGNVTD